MKPLTFGAGSMWQWAWMGVRQGCHTEAEGAPQRALWPSTLGTPLPDEAGNSRNPNC